MVRLGPTDRDMLRYVDTALAANVGETEAEELRQWVRENI
jgi:hypothetical protein